MNVSDEGRAPERFAGPYISANAFSADRRDSRSSAAISCPKTTAPARRLCVLLGNGIWKNRYGSDPAVIGRDDQGQRAAGHRHRRDAGGHSSFRPTPTCGCRWRSRRARRSRSATRATSRSSAGSPTASRVAQAQAELNAIATPAGARLSRRPTRTSRATVMTFNERVQRRPDQAGVPVADGRRRLRAADRVRERRQPAAGALGEPLARDLRPRVARRDALAHRPAAAGRERAARDHQRRARPRRSSIVGIRLFDAAVAGRRQAVLDGVHDGRAACSRSSPRSASAPASSSASRRRCTCRRPTSTKC